MITGITIRRADASDFADIIHMLVEMHSEMGIFSLSVERLTARVYAVLKSGICLIADIDGSPAGTIGLIGDIPWYTDDRTLADTWIFVRKGKRSLKIFGEMVREARSVANQMGFPLVLTLYSLKDQDRKARLFERHAHRIMTGFLFLEAGGEFIAQEA